MGEKQVFK